MDENGVLEREKWYQTLITRYWKRRSYQKLNRPSRTKRQRRARVELGSDRKSVGRFWRIKISPNLRFLRTVPSPKKLLLRLRDAYVRMMLAFSNSRVFSAGYGGAAPVVGDIAGFGRRPVKEYDEKMIVEIYKSMVAAQRRPAGGPETETAVAR